MCVRGGRRVDSFRILPMLALLPRPSGKSTWHPVCFLCDNENEGWDLGPAAAAAAFLTASASVL